MIHTGLTVWYGIARRKRPFMRGTKLFKRFWILISLAAILHVAIFDLRILISSESLQVQYVPDDAYYYLTLARNFVRTGLWTFDSGISTATGFHPLFAYLLSLLYQLFRPTTREFVLYALVFEALVTLAISLSAWGFGVRQRKPFFLMFLTLLTSSTNFAYNSISATEWPLAVGFASLYVFLFYRSLMSARHSVLRLFIVGFLGSLSRTDFGLLPFCLCVATLVLSSFDKKSENKRALTATFGGLVGASFGVSLTLTHNYLFSGSFLQSSAKMKAHWGQIMGTSYRAPARLLFNMVFGIRDVYLFIALITIVFTILLCIILDRTRDQRSLPDLNAYINLDQRLPELTLAIATLVCTLGYWFLYAHNSAGIQPWYSSNLLVPIFVLFTLSASYFDNIAQYVLERGYLALITVGISVAVLGIAGRNIAIIHSHLARSIWPHQQFMLKAGKYLAQHSLDGKIASWNAGIIGYYQGGTVVNIDGLVNDDIYGYAVNNELPFYLRKIGVDYVIDFKQMFTHKPWRVKGGYDDVDFLNSLQPVKTFDNGQYGFKYLTLYRLLP